MKKFPKLVQGGGGVIWTMTKRIYVLFWELSKVRLTRIENVIASQFRKNCVFLLLCGSKQKFAPFFALEGCQNKSNIVSLSVKLFSRFFAALKSKSKTIRTSLPTCIAFKLQCINVTFLMTMSLTRAVTWFLGQFFPAAVLAFMNWIISMMYGCERQ